MKKSWHPLLMKNQERVWKEERKAVEERKKTVQLQKELAEERQLQELQRLQAAQGGGRREERVDWLYATPATGNGVNTEEQEAYLLGKKTVDKLFKEKDEAAAKLAARASKTDQDKPGGGFISLQNANTARDTASKIREDPLLAIKQQEQLALETAMKNPNRLKAMKLEKASKEERKKEKELRRLEKEERRRAKEDRKERKRGYEDDRYDDDRNGYRSKDHHQSQRVRRSSPDRQDRIRRSPSYDHHHRRSPSPEHSRRRSLSPPNRERHQSRNSRSRSPPRRRQGPHSNQPISPPRRDYPNKPHSGRSFSPKPPSHRPHSQAAPTRPIPSTSSKLSESKAAKLAEMQANAQSLNQSRSQRLKELETEDLERLKIEEMEREKNRIKSGGVGDGTRAKFVRDQEKKVFFGEMDLGERVKRSGGVGMMKDAE